MSETYLREAWPSTGTPFRALNLTREPLHLVNYVQVAPSVFRSKGKKKSERRSIVASSFTYRSPRRNVQILRGGHPPHSLGSATKHEGNSKNGTVLRYSIECGEPEGKPNISVGAGPTSRADVVCRRTEGVLQPGWVAGAGVGLTFWGPLFRLAKGFHPLRLSRRFGMGATTRALTLDTRKFATSRPVEPQPRDQNRRCVGRRCYAI